MYLSKKSFLVAVSLLILLAAVATLFIKNHQDSLDARLSTPAPLLQELLKPGTPLFVTPEFLPFIPASQLSLCPSLSDSEVASRDKSAFWKLNREDHFAAVFIGLNPAWRPFAESLLNSPLWVLSDVSPWGYLFRVSNPANAPWQLPSEKELATRFPHANDRAHFLILTAASLITINHLSEAQQLLDMAESTHHLTSLLLSTRASLAASQGRWEEAAKLARASLHADTSNRAAAETLVRSLIESGRTDEALTQARDLVARLGEDETTLFLLARAANTANSGKEEIDALARLVTIARNNHQPLGASLAYLGQAYAKQGDRGDALRTFQEAAAAPEVTEDQRKMLRDIMDHLMEGSASSSTLPALKEPLMKAPRQTNQ